MIKPAEKPILKEETMNANNAGTQLRNRVLVRAVLMADQP
jgi:hypothetical protein